MRHHLACLRSLWPAPPGFYEFGLHFSGPSLSPNGQDLSRAGLEVEPQWPPLWLISFPFYFFFQLTLEYLPLPTCLDVYSFAQHFAEIYYFLGRISGIILIHVIILVWFLHQVHKITYVQFCLYTYYKKNFKNKKVYSALFVHFFTVESCMWSLHIGNVYLILI